MSLSSTIRSMLARVAERRAAWRRLSEFTCGDCDRSHRCSLLPTADCIARQEQIARGAWEAKRKAKVLLYESNWT